MKVEPAVRSTVILPVWQPNEKAKVENPAYDFIRRFLAGREPIVWTREKQSLTTNDPTWLLECCNEIAGLSRAELCVLHIYSTQAYSRVTHFLRGASPKELDLVYDSSCEWKAGEMPMLANVRANNQSRYLSSSVDPVALRALLAAWRAPRSEAEFEMCLQRYSALRPYFTPKFLRVCRIQSVRFHGGVMFAAEAGMSLASFEKAIPQMTSWDWQRIVRKFVKALDAIFQKMPPCRKTFYVYRGEGADAKSVRRGWIGSPSFVSTSLGQSIALDFARPTMVRITVPKGSRVLPLLCVSRYREQEMLLPRRFTCTVSRFDGEN